MLSAAKHLCAHRERPFAALRVTTQLAAPGMAMDLYRERPFAALRVTTLYRCWYCHAERSEASLCPSRETLRCAQGDNQMTTPEETKQAASREILSEAKGDNIVPMLGVKVHHRAGAGGGIPGEAVPLPSAINVAATPLHVTASAPSRPATKEKRHKCRSHDKSGTYAPSRDAYWATARATQLERLARGEPNAPSRDAYWATARVTELERLARGEPNAPSRDAYVAILGVAQ